MPHRSLHALPQPSRLALAALLCVGLTGWGVSLSLAARSLGPDTSLGDCLSPDATRLRTCAPPLERAIETTMRKHIPRPGERAALVRWMRHGARMEHWYRGPQRIVAGRCATCHGRTPQAGIRLETYADALSLASLEGRDPYRRRQHLHVHLFAIGAVLALLLLGLGRSRFPPWVTYALGVAPVVALLASVPLALWACATGWAPYLIWGFDGIVVLAWPASSVLLLWDLFASTK